MKGYYFTTENGDVYVIEGQVELSGTSYFIAKCVGDGVVELFDACELATAGTAFFGTREAAEAHAALGVE